MRMAGRFPYPLPPKAYGHRAPRRGALCFEIPKVDTDCYRGRLPPVIENIASNSLTLC